MPHLSPMSWIMSIMIFWLSLSFLMSTFWWSESHLFDSSTSHKSSPLLNPWNWLLQDGRD